MVIIIILKIYTKIFSVINYYHYKSNLLTGIFHNFIIATFIMTLCKLIYSLIYFWIAHVISLFLLMLCENCMENREYETTNQSHIT